MQRLSGELKAKLPEGWTAKRLTKAMEDHHPAIAHLFGSDVGIELMFAESQILMAALVQLETSGIPSLPMHDGLMVPLTKRQHAKVAMQQAAIQIVGSPLSISEKEILPPNANLPLYG